jgi:glycosyltransferase involved in cell wall biosynthesis
LKVLFFTDGPESPGSRFRCLQFFPALRARGIECEARFAYDTRYNDYFEKPWAPAYKLAARLKRVGHLLLAGDADIVFLHKTALAFSGIPERLRGLRSAKIVFDFDDAIYLGPGGAPSRLRESAFRHVVRVADHVIAGNGHLGEVAGVPEKTSIIPSVVDTERFTPRPSGRTGKDLVVGWIGTASNFPNVEAVMPEVLAAIERLPNARLRIVSNGVMSRYEAHPRVEHWRWHEDRELQALNSFDIGLMPLADNEQTRGKCGFKMIQYMAVGVPVISSAVGANVDIFEGSGAGVLVKPGESWTEPIVTLALDAEARRAQGEAGRRHVVARYSLDSVIDRYTQLFARMHAKT